MDANQQVVIETGGSLTPGVYRAVSARFCMTEQILIQVWTPMNADTFRLKWQTSVTPTATDTLQDYVTVQINKLN